MARRKKQQETVCPVCGEMGLDWDDQETDGEWQYNDWHCAACGSEGQAVSRIKFQYHSISRIRNMYAGPDR